MTEQPLYIVYRNWRGETGVREVYPKAPFYGVTQWHPEPQWFLPARDAEKGMRDFAMSDILSMHNAYDDAENSMRQDDDLSTIAVGDEFDKDGLRLKVERIIPATPRTEPTPFMPAMPATDESYQVIELNGITPGATWTASRSFFRVHCTRVQVDKGSTIV